MNASEIVHDAMSESRGFLAPRILDATAFTAAIHGLELSQCNGVRLHGRTMSGGFLCDTTLTRNTFSVTFHIEEHAFLHQCNNHRALDPTFSNSFIETVLAKLLISELPNQLLQQFSKETSAPFRHCGGSFSSVSRSENLDV